MCKRCGESVDYLFLHIEIASALNSAIFSCVGLTWVMPRRVVDLFVCWRGLSGSPQSVTMWKMVPLYLWRERNDRSFEDCERTVVKLKYFFNTFYHCITALNISKKFHLLIKKKHLNLLGFRIFLTFFSFFPLFLARGVFSVYFMYIWVALFNDISPTY
jgi:hypothetical protein